MIRGIVSLMAALIVIGATGCQKEQPAAPKEPALEDMLPKQAQPRLQTMKLWIGAEELDAELALTGEQRMIGMMFRTNMAENEGMFFVQPETGPASFWMKNCPLPLSIAYIDPEGVILEIHNLRAHDTNPVVSASTNIQFALETPQGWFERHNVGTGTVIRTERGSLAEVFLRQ